MTTTTTRLGLTKAQGTDIARDYLKTSLPATLDIVDTAATLTGAQDLSGKSLIADRAIGAVSGVFRVDAGVEIRRSTDAGLSLFQNSAPGSTTYEAFIAYGAYSDTSTGPFKTASVSSKLVNPTVATIEGVLRLSATKFNGAGGTADSVSIRIFGNQGVDVFGSSDTVGPGAGKLRIAGATTVSSGSFAVTAGTVGVGTTADTIAQVKLGGTFNGGGSGFSLGLWCRSTLQAGANNDLLAAAYLNPTAYDANGKTGTTAFGIFLGDVTGAATNYALYSGAGAVRLGGEVTAAAATATPAGGSTAARLLFGTTAGFGVYYGSGAPSVSAAQGSLYLRSDGSSTSTRLYVNTTGSTTWTNVTTAA